MGIKSAAQNILIRLRHRQNQPIDPSEEFERQEQLKRFFKFAILFFACPAMVLMWWSDEIFEFHTADRMLLIRVFGLVMMIPTCLITLRQKSYFRTQLWATITGSFGYFAVHLIYYLREDPNSHFVYALLPGLVIVATGMRLNWFFYFLNCALIILPTFFIGLYFGSPQAHPLFLIDMMNWILTMTFCTTGRWFFERIYNQERMLRNALKNETNEREFLLSQAINDLIAGNQVSSVVAEKVPKLIPQWEALTSKLQEYKDKEAEVISSRRLADLARQVAHDIRSPLSALSMMTEVMSEISEEKRLIVKTAAVRINDIANELLSRSAKMSVSDVENEDKQAKREILMLPAIVDQLASEKRAQYSKQGNVKIETNLAESFGAFVLAQNREIMRLLSNLVDNAVESLREGGVVAIGVTTLPESVMVCIGDNGIGIPTEVLQQVGQKGFSYGKIGTYSGAGLGVYHAKTLVQSMGGKFEIRSVLGKGTTIEMTLKRAAAPSWFLEEMMVRKSVHVVIMDDDQSMHQLWKSRLRDMVASNHAMSVTSFTSPAEFANFVSVSKNTKNFLFLVDFELLPYVETGLDLIIKLGIENQSVLVTSHWEELRLRTKCVSHNIKLLPKSLAGFIPVRLVK